MVDNCKHVKEIRNGLQLGLLQQERWKCSVCSTTESVWACLHCANIACGWYISEHALQHYQTSKHPLCMEINEQFVYCYACNDYILNDNAPGDIKLMRMTLDAVVTEQLDTFLCGPEGRRNLRSEVPTHHLKLINGKRRLLMRVDRIQTALIKRRLCQLRGAFTTWKNVYRERGSCSSATEETQKKLQRNIPCTGLRNLGNTCYMNSVLQALCHTAPFVSFIVTHSRQSEHNYSDDSLSDTDIVDSPLKKAAIYNLLSTVKKCRRRTTVGDASQGLSGGHETSILQSGVISCRLEHSRGLYGELRLLFRAIWNGKRAIISPYSFLYSVWVEIPSFKGYRQQDAQEFLCILLEKLQNAVHPLETEWHPLRQDFVTRTFQGSLLNKINCHNCGYLAEKEELFLDLSLPFPPALCSVRKACHLICLLNSYMSETLLEEASILSADKEKIESKSMRSTRTSAEKRSNASSNESVVSKKFCSDMEENESGRGAYVCPICCSQTEDICHLSDSSDKLRDSPLINLSSPTNVPRVKMSQHYCHGSTVIRNSQFSKLPLLALQDGQQNNHVSKVMASQKSCFYRLPRVLRLHLKRFRWSGSLREKIQTYVEFPETLDLVEWCHDKMFQSSNSPKLHPSLYQLTAVIVHHGKGFQTGHYTAYCYIDEIDAWVHCNDSVIQLSTIEEVQNSQAYILFYSQVLYNGISVSAS